MRATAYRFVSETRVALQLIPAGVYVATAYRPSRIAIGGRRGTPAEARRETTVEVERRDSDAFRGERSAAGPRRTGGEGDDHILPHPCSAYCRAIRAIPIGAAMFRFTLTLRVGFCRRTALRRLSVLRALRALRAGSVAFFSIPQCAYVHCYSPLVTRLSLVSVACISSRGLLSTVSPLQYVDVSRSNLSMPARLNPLRRSARPHLRCRAGKTCVHSRAIHIQKEAPLQAI